MGPIFPKRACRPDFLKKYPRDLLEELGSKRRPAESYAASGSYSRSGSSVAHHDEHSSTHYSYEDEDQSANRGAKARAAKAKPASPTPSYNSIDNIAEFFASRGKKFNLPKTALKSPRVSGASGPARTSAIRNMARARSTSEKEMGKMPRLRYNSRGSD